jgi:asparagine synthase (glutamine-hydrolysing)
MPRRRAQAIADHNRSILARAAGVELSSPLLDPEFIHAVARAGGFRGPGDRTATLQQLAGDLLPPQVLSRRTKAVFNRAYISNYSLRFAESWSGEGVDLELVDPDGLRRTWLDQPPHWMSAALLQQAWLAANGRSAQ